MVGFAEGGITRLRRERKLLLDPEESPEVARRLEANTGATPADTRIAVVYFDAAGSPLARRARETPSDCVKVRAKMYHPNRAAPGSVVLEVKRERGGVTTKARTWLARGDVRAALRRDVAPALGTGALAPVVATGYRRRVFQRCASWRVTLDDELTFHAATWELFVPTAPAWHLALESAFAAARHVVLELKFGSEELPPWLEALGTPRETPYSKFVEALAHAAPVRSAGA